MKSPKQIARCFGKCGLAEAAQAGGDRFEGPHTGEIPQRREQGHTAFCTTQSDICILLRRSGIEGIQFGDDMFERGVRAIPEYDRQKFNLARQALGQKSAIAEYSGEQIAGGRGLQQIFNASVARQVRRLSRLSSRRRSIPRATRSESVERGDVKNWV